MTKDEIETNLATYEHLEHIRSMLAVFAAALIARGEFTPKLKAMTYGSDEYTDCLKAMAPALRHHYACNRHHPEHFTEGISGMNLIDLVEMFIDWKASGKRMADGGDMQKSIDVGAKRFVMDPQLVAIFRNTEADLARGDLEDNSTVPMGGPRCVPWGDQQI